MFFVELSNGQFFTSTSHTWQDIVKMMAEDEKLTIRQLGLTDMYHIRESISGADAYYYFTDAQATLQNRMIDGELRSVPLPPKVIAEEIAGFYSVESAQKIFKQNIEACDSSIVELEKRLAELRATTITSEKLQDEVNREISQKQGLLDQTKQRRERLLDERDAAIEAGGFIVSHKLHVGGTKFPVDTPIDTPVPSRIREQDPQYWIGSVKPEFPKREAIHA